MDSLFVQNLRYKLQKRVSRLNAADGSDTFSIMLTQFWQFFDQQSTFVGIVEMLIAQNLDVQDTVEKIFSGEALFGETEEEAAIIGYFILRQVAQDGVNNRIINLGMAYRRAGKGTAALDFVRDQFLEPFYEYVDEQLDDQKAMLALLIRYKHRSEWFNQDRLWNLSQNGGEKQLALDLYAYLYDQGIDFHIEPSSLAGEIDLIAAQGSEDPLLLDTKIFDGSGRGKSYLKKGFNQIYTYTQQYNEPFGYLVIYKTTERDLSFALKRTQRIPLVVHNHKSIFLLTIDLYPHEKPVSQRGPLKATEITEEELIQKLSEELEENSEEVSSMDQE